MWGYLVHEAALKCCNPGQEMAHSRAAQSRGNHDLACYSDFRRRMPPKIEVAPMGAKDLLLLIGTKGATPCCFKP